MNIFVQIRTVYVRIRTNTYIYVQDTYIFVQIRTVTYTTRMKCQLKFPVSCQVHLCLRICMYSYVSVRICTYLVRICTYAYGYHWMCRYVQVCAGMCRKMAKYKSTYLYVSVRMCTYCQWYWVQKCKFGLTASHQLLSMSSWFHWAVGWHFSGSQYTQALAVIKLYANSKHVHSACNTGEVYEIAQVKAGPNVSPVPVFLSSDATLVSKSMGGHPIISESPNTSTVWTFWF